MPTPVTTPEQLLAELPADSFDDYASFESTLIESVNARRFDLPPGYGWRDLLDWALRAQLIHREGTRIVVRK